MNRWWKTNVNRSNRYQNVLGKSVRMIHLIVELKIKRTRYWQRHNKCSFTFDGSLLITWALTERLSWSPICLWLAALSAELSRSQLGIARVTVPWLVFAVSSRLSHVGESVGSIFETSAKQNKFSWDATISQLRWKKYGPHYFPLFFIFLFDTYFLYKIKISIGWMKKKYEWMCKLSQQQRTDSYWNPPFQLSNIHFLKEPKIDLVITYNYNFFPPMEKTVNVFLDHCTFRWRRFRIGTAVGGFKSVRKSVRSLVVSANGDVSKAVPDLLQFDLALQTRSHGLMGSTHQFWRSHENAFHRKWLFILRLHSWLFQTCFQHGFCGWRIFRRVTWVVRFWVSKN